MKRGKKYQDNLKSFDKAELFDLDAAVAQVKKMATANFDESIEMHIKLGVDSRHADQQVRGAIVLPNGTGNTLSLIHIQMCIRDRDNGLGFEWENSLPFDVRQSGGPASCCVATLPQAGVAQLKKYTGKQVTELGSFIKTNLR